MKTIGYIVIIALIVSAAIYFSKKKTESKPGEQTDGTPESANPIADMVNMPIDQLQLKLQELEQTVRENAIKLNEAVPLVSQVPPAEQIVIVEPKPVTPATPLQIWKNAPGSFVDKVRFLKTQQV